MTERLDYTYDLYLFTRAVDGDTVDMTVMRKIDFGFKQVDHKFYTGRFRLVNVDTPERGEANYREAGYYVAQWIENHPILKVDTHKDPDNFGRYLADIYVPTTGESLSEALLKAGLAVPYEKR